MPTLETDHGKGVGGVWVGDHEASVAKDWVHFHLHPLFSFDTRAPESHSFISVESGTTHSPVWGRGLPLHFRDLQPISLCSSVKIV